MRSPDIDGRTPLHWAAYKGVAHSMRLLIVLDAQITAGDREGCTPLHWAAIRGNSEACTVLLQVRWPRPSTIWELNVLFYSLPALWAPACHIQVTQSRSRQPQCCHDPWAQECRPLATRIIHLFSLEEVHA